MISPYDLHADRYEDEAAKRLYGAVARDLVAWLPPGASLRALELGCGTGISTEIFLEARPGWNWWGSDLSAPMLARARGKVALDGVTWLQARAEQLPLPEQAFDVVVSSVAWHWFDGARALGEVRRVLRPGGRLLLAVPVRATGARESGNAAVRRAMVALRHAGLAAAAPGWGLEDLSGPFEGFTVESVNRIDRVETFPSTPAWLDALETRGALVAMFGPAAPSAPEVLGRVHPAGDVSYRWAIARVVLNRN